MSNPQTRVAEPTARTRDASGPEHSTTGPLATTAGVNVLSLFAGIGGLELGLERAGMNVVGQVELDPWRRSVLAKHWPEVPRHDDVRTTATWWDSEPRPRVDVVAGGYPCQPFSNAGLQRGVDDERWLWPAMADVVRHIRPRYVVVENVASLVRDADAFGWMLGDLAALGFDAEWTVLRASDFGAPHPRERLYLLAYPASVDGPSRDLLGQGGERRAPLAVGRLSGLPVAARRESSRAWLEAEPRVDLLVDGLPGRVDELAGYGNAVVPRAAQHIGEALMAHLRTEVPA